MKTCTKCGETKDDSEFHRDVQKSDNLSSWCKTCKRSANSAVYHRNPQIARARWLRNAYGLTVEHHQEMTTDQGGCCAICGRAEPLAVDHNHETGKVRGLLCANCNRALGLLREDLTAMQSMIDYIRRDQE